jgi:hypothetical protein
MTLFCALASFDLVQILIVGWDQESSHPVSNDGSHILSFSSLRCQSSKESK